MRIYLNETEVHAPYEKVALLFAESSTELGNEVKVIRATQQQAAELGADGIILLALGVELDTRDFVMGFASLGRLVSSDSTPASCRCQRLQVLPRGGSAHVKAVEKYVSS